MSGVKWTGSAQIVIQILSLARWFILVSFIAPEYYGIAALGIMIVSLPRLLIEESTSSALIRHENPDNNLLNSCFWFNIGIAFLVIAIFIPIAYAISIYLSEFLIFYVFLAYAFFSLLESTSQVHAVLLKKDLEFRFLAETEILSFIGGTCLSIVLAVYEFYWQAIVSQAVTGYIISALRYYFKANFRIKFYFSIQEIKKVFSFSLYVFGYRLMTYLMTYLDDFLIGNFYGTKTLGVYDRSYQLAHMPMRKITNKISSVLYPAYSANQTDTAQINEIHLSVIRISILFYIPVLAGFIIFSESLVSLFLPDRWNDVGSLLPIIAAGAIFRALANHNSSIFLVYNRPDLLLRFGFFSRLSGVIGIIIGFFGDIESICFGYSFGCLIGLLIEWKGIQQFGLSFDKIFDESKSSFILITIISLIMFLPIFTAISDKLHFFLRLVSFFVFLVIGYYYLHKELLRSLQKKIK